jgi:hypothetical protein
LMPSEDASMKTARKPQPTVTLSIQLPRALYRAMIETAADRTVGAWARDVLKDAAKRGGPSRGGAILRKDGQAWGEVVAELIERYGPLTLTELVRLTNGNQGTLWRTLRGKLCGHWFYQTGNRKSPYAITAAGRAREWREPIRSGDEYDRA